jgi:bacterial/archaeal transporter family protein
MTNAWLFWAFLSAILAAATAILTKVGLRGVDPDLAQCIRTAVVLTAVAAFVLVTGKWRHAAGIPTQAWLYLALAGLATAGSWMCYFRALQLGPAARVAAIDKLSVPLVAVFAAILLAERLGPAAWLGILLTAAGATLIALAK